MAISLKNNVDHDQWQILAAYDEYSSLQRYYVYGNYIDEVLVMNDGADDTYYAHDHLYSPAALLDDTGAVVERYEYDAYGRVQILNSTFSILNSSQYANAYTFTGRQLDLLDNGNLHHMHYRHRDYSPQLGRFMQHDPLGMIPNDFYEEVDGEFHNQYLDSLNLYQYGLNNSIINFDPLGKGIGRIIGCFVCMPALGKAAAECRSEWKSDWDACNSIGDPWDNAEHQKELKEKQRQCMKEKLGIFKWCIRCGHFGIQ